MEKPDELSSDSDVEQIKAEISETQVELQQTVAEIQDRLSPAHLKDQAASTVRDATIGKVQHMMQGNNNSIPYALIGIGAAWLLASRRSSDRRWNGYDTSERGWDSGSSEVLQRAHHRIVPIDYERVAGGGQRARVGGDRARPRRRVSRA